MQSKLEKLLLEVSKSELIDAGDLQRAQELILHCLLEGLGILRAGLWMFDEAAAGIRCTLLIDLHHQTREEDVLLKRVDYPRYFAALDSERRIAADDARSHPATSEFTEGYLRPLGITSMMDTPIRHRGHMVGVVCCEHIGPMRQWHEDEQIFAASVADLVGRAISAKERNDYASELEQLNASLEQLVQQRTASLQQTLERLQRTQQQLIDSEMMASLGSLVSGVAHEVNTPLGIAVTATSHCQHIVDVIRSELPADSAQASRLESMAKGLELVAQNVAKAVELIQNLKNTAVDQQSLTLKSFELGDYIRVVVSSISPRLNAEKVALELDTPQQLWMNSYPGALAQILTTLAGNACTHAFTDDASAAGSEPAEKRIRIAATALDGDRVELLFEDNGAGMDADTAKHIFQPFYTTRRGRGSTGLGLFICHNLATVTLKGSLQAESTPGAGSRFRLTMPVNVEA